LLWACDTPAIHVAGEDHRLVRTLAEDPALEILASYTPDGFQSAGFSGLGEAVVHLADHEDGPGLAFRS
jgi:hypothetical protein